MAFGRPLYAMLMSSIHRLVWEYKRYYIFWSPIHLPLTMVGIAVYSITLQSIAK